LTKTLQRSTHKSLEDIKIANLFGSQSFLDKALCGSRGSIIIKNE